MPLAPRTCAVDNDAMNSLKLSRKRLLQSFNESLYCKRLLLKCQHSLVV
jgi:hypothetical protein